MMNNAKKNHIDVYYPRNVFLALKRKLFDLLDFLHCFNNFSLVYLRGRLEIALSGHEGEMLVFCAAIIVS